MLEAIVPILAVVAFGLGAWKLKLNQNLLLIGIMAGVGALAAPAMLNTLPVIGEVVGLLITMGVSLIAGAIVVYIVHLLAKSMNIKF